jgi:hypothetical protein
MGTDLREYGMGRVWVTGAPLPARHHVYGKVAISDVLLRTPYCISTADDQSTLTLNISLPAGWVEMKGRVGEVPTVTMAFVQGSRFRSGDVETIHRVLKFMAAAFGVMWEEVWFTTQPDGKTYTIPAPRLRPE